MDLSLIIAAVVALLGIPAAVLATMQIMTMRASRNSRQIETTPPAPEIAPPPVETANQQRSLAVDTRALMGGLLGEGWHLPYDKFTHVAYLLKYIADNLGGVYTKTDYGKKWLVHDAYSNKILAEADGKILPDDMRTLQEAGIKPGMRLEAFPFSPSVERQSHFSGKGSGTYSHRLDVVPDQVSIMPENRAASFRVVSITSTDIEIVINSSVGFDGFAVKYAPINPQEINPEAYR